MNLSPGWIVRLIVCTSVLTGAGACRGHHTLQERTSTPLNLTVAQGPVLPISTAGHAGGLVNGWPVVAGGSHWSDDKTTKRWLTETFVYRDGGWKSGPALPGPLSDAAYATSPSAGLVIAGGNEGKQAVAPAMQLQESNGVLKWRPLAPLPIATEAASGAIIANTMYVQGGYAGDQATGALWSLDLSNPNSKWQALSPLPGPPRGWSALAAIDHKLYLFGGFVYPPFAKDVTVYGDAWCYDIATDRWMSLGNFNLVGYGWTATDIGNGQLLLTGRCPKAGETTADILQIDLKTLQIKNVGQLVEPGCCAPSIRIDKNTWWIPGGEPDTNRSRSARTSVLKFGL